MTAGKPLLWGALFAGGGLFLALNIWGLALTGGEFVYPLDDTYIHLSMAEQIAKGEYGINPHQFASADSSIIYPFLLVPFAGTEFHQYLPLILNALALLAGLVLMHKILLKSGFLAELAAGPLMLLILVVAPVSMNMIGVAMLGMEQILHVLTVLAALLGVVLWHEERRVNAYLIAAILIGPLIRYEATGLSLLLALMVFIEGKRKAGAALAVAATAPLFGFSWFLYAHEGTLLPNSVLRKISLAKLTVGENGSLLLKNFNGGDYEVVAWVLLAFAGVFAILLAMPAVRRDRLALRMGLIALASLVGQVFIGRNGWGNRHETYVIVLSMMAFFVAVRPLLQSQNRLGRVGALLAAGVLLLPLTHFARQTITFGPLSMRNIYDQQWQMARFARDYVQAPVAVNDIGLPSYRNDNIILDLWGLASDPALKAWAARAPRGWINDLAKANNADLAMVYESWILPGVGPGWTKIGYLKLRGMRYSAAGQWVTFFATNHAAVPHLQAMMRAFRKSLPDPLMLDILNPPEPFVPETEVNR